MKMITTVLVALMMVSGTIRGIMAEPAEIESYNALSGCFDENGVQLMALSMRKVVITNDGEGTVNVSIKGICPTTSATAVNWSNDDFVGVTCSAGSAGAVPYWKYHMRPDGQFSAKCSSYPLED